MNEDLERLKQELESLKAVRNKLSVKEENKKEESSTDISKNFKEELKEIEEEIKEFENDIKETAKEYEKSYQRIKSIIDEHEEIIENTNLLSEEEINELREKYETQKLEENEMSNKIKRRLDDQKKILRSINRHKTQMLNNIKAAEALELTYEEYKDVTSTLRKTKIMHAILEEKGLLSIIEKKYSERTKEEKQAFKNAKTEIINEISELKKEHDDYSVLDAIEALYSLNTTYIRVEKPKQTTFQLRELMIIEENSHRLSYRVVNPNTKVNTNIVEEAPKDMENATANEKVDINELKPASEKVTIFKDDDTYYVRRYAIDRFKLKSADLDSEVKINGSMCYKISEKDVEKIKENANNTFSPFVADIKEINLDKEATKKEETSLMVVSQEEIDNKEEIEESNNIEKITIFKEENDRYYANEYTIDRFKLKSANKEEEIRIDGALYYEISEEDAYKLVENKDNSFSPYEVYIEEVEEKEDDITHDETNDIIEEIPEEEINDIVEENIESDKKEKLIEDLVASNIVVNKEFKKELKIGKTLYNIYHSIPRGIKKVYKAVKEAIKEADDFLGGLIEGPIKDTPEEEISKTR